MINEHCGAQTDKMFVLVIPYINTKAVELNEIQTSYT
jgi:hypothetical protein